MSDGPAQVEARPAGLALDPFGFFGGVASRVLGLGGAAPGHDPSYVFHTPYVAAARGEAHFDIRFRGLRARRGTLALRVHMLPDEPGGVARLVNSSRIQLNRLVQNDGVASIDFQGYRGFTFALLGQILDDTDASAERLEVTLDRPADPSERHEPAEDIRAASIGFDAFRPSADLVSAEPPRLAFPVSQACTAEQMAEPLWAERCRELGLPPEPDPVRWPAIFSLEALRRYDLLRPGVRALIVDAAGELDAVRDRIGAAADGAGPWDVICSSAPLAAAEPAGTAVDAVLDALRPGGFAIVFLPLRRGRSFGTGDARLARADVERLALRLISRGHELAQLKPGDQAGDGSGVAVPFGLVLRRAGSPVR